MIDKIIHTIAGFVAIVPFVWGMMIFQKSQRIIKCLTILAGIAFITEVTSRILAELSMSNHFLFHIYPVIELGIFFLIYKSSFHQRVHHKVLVILAALFLLFSIINMTYVQLLYDFNTYGRGIESIILALISIFFLVNNLNNEEAPNKKSSPMFWINTSVLLYFPLNIVFIFMNNYLYANFSRDFNNFLWDIHALLSFTQYILFTIAIYTEWKRTKSPALS